MEDEELVKLTIPQLEALKIRVNNQIKIKRKQHKIEHIARMICISVEGNFDNSKKYEKISSDVIPVIEMYEVAQGYTRREC